MRLLRLLCIFNVALSDVIASVILLNATKEPFTPKDIEFVEVIKKDLRRNNDDYSDALYDIRNKSDTSLSKKHITVAKTELQNETKDLNKVKGVRRDYNDLRDENYDSLLQVKHEFNTNITNEPNKRALMKKINRMVPTYKLASLARNINQSTTSSKPVHQWKIKTHSKFNINNLKTMSIRKLTTRSSTASLTTESTSKHIMISNKKKERFKFFLKKNKGLFNNFMSSKFDKTYKIQTASPAPVDHIMSSLKKSIYGRAKMAVRSRDNNNGTLPETELLDMAPAKGGRISQKRLKGRLCHRHVLMPEGPKYDSRGRWYLAAHGLVARRPYERTRRPTMLLPRCCNCCKKSVLGCE